jgi:transcriptional regulator with XRE-family HTH domain
MKQAQLSEIERGMRPLRVDQLMMIAQVLKCSASHLLGEDKSVA